MTVLALDKSLNKQEQDQAFRALLTRASEAGTLAANQAVPAPMVVSDRSTGDNWFVSEGPCGFAWVSLRPATSKFARWLKANKFDQDRWVNEADGGAWSADSYAGGYKLWVWVGGQSLTRKAAFAGAYASVLQEAGFQAYAQSRMD